MDKKNRHILNKATKIGHSRQIDHPEASVCIDGSGDSGGGQIVRVSLALSSVLSRSVRINNVRAARPQPGLRAQHLTGANLVARIISAPLVGAVLSSKTLYLGPTEQTSLHSLPLRADVGTAGGVALVLQAALPAALRCLPSLDTILTISGGTTTHFAPSSEYVCNVFIPNLKHFGLNLTFDVLRHGFFPKGGGICDIKVDKSACNKVYESEQEFKYVLRTCNLTNRGKIKSIKGSVLVCGEKYIHAEVADAMRTKSRQVLRKFCRSEMEYIDISEDDIAVKVLEDKEGIGECVAVTLWATTSADTVLGGSSIWSSREANKFASHLGLATPRRGAQQLQKVEFWQQTAACAGEQAAEELCEALRSGAVVDSYMADQLCIFMAMSCGTSRLLVPEPTLHLTSVMKVFRSFGIDICIEDLPDSENKHLICVGKAVALRS